jgi:hypothetical protein
MRVKHCPLLHQHRGHQHRAVPAVSCVCERPLCWCPAVGMETFWCNGAPVLTEVGLGVSGNPR